MMSVRSVDTDAKRTRMGVVDIDSSCRVTEVASVERSRRVWSKNTLRSNVTRAKPGNR